MELITTKSEEKLIDLLARIEKESGAWSNVHVNLSRISEQLLEKESLSAKTLENIRQSSRRIASILMDSELQGLEGNLFIFEDSDVIALFRKDAGFSGRAIEKLRQDFTACGMGDLFSFTEMQEQLAFLVKQAREKQESAKAFYHRRRAVEAAETIFASKVPDPELTRAIMKRRYGRAKKCALIIEDDVVARSMVALALRESCEVIQAKDAKSGIVAYIDKAPDVVFLDIHLPDHSGHEVLKCLKVLEPQAHVVMLSGDSVSDNVLSAKGLGAGGFVRKPFTKEILLHYVNSK